MTKRLFDDILSSDTFREEFFIAEAQSRLGDLMEIKGITRAELARRLDVSRARVTQIFSDESKNFTVRLLVRSFLALGEEPMIISRSEYTKLQDRFADRKETSGQSATATVEGLTEAVIANLLRANVGERAVDGDRPKRISAAGDWAAAGLNVIPFREKANG